MISFKGYMIFSLPLFFSMVFQSSAELDIDLVLVVVALVTSAIGSSTQITHKNLKKSISIKEISAIYTTGVMVALMAYFLGVWQNNLVIAALASVFGSYMSLDLFEGMKKAVIGILGVFPKAFEMYVKSKTGIGNYNSPGGPRQHQRRSEDDDEFSDDI